MRGWIKLHRQIINSDIYQMSPLYLRVFVRLIIEANHQNAEIPFKYPGDKVTTKKLIKRGERQTSIRQICKWVGWYEYGVFKEPSPKTIKVILDWLAENKMIEVYPRKSNREGTHYKIINYGVYQASDNEKVTARKQSGNSQETVTTPKQECSKNDKNVNKLYNSFFDTYNNQNIIKHKQLTPKMKQAINRALKKDRQEDILKAMGRYGQAFRDKEYPFCTYKMTLDKFLTQGNGYTDWLDEGQKWINYNDFKNRSLDQTTTQRQGEQKFKTKFHLAKSRGDKYTAEELERIVLENSRRKLEEKT